MASYFERRAEQKKEMRQLVETITLGHQNTREAKQKLQEMKQQIGLVVKPIYNVTPLRIMRVVREAAKESQQLMARALEEV